MGTRRFVIRDATDLGNTIAEARDELGLTQAELAERTRMERSYLSRLEGGTVVQQVDRVLGLLRALGVEVTATMEVDDG